MSEDVERYNLRGFDVRIWNDPDTESPRDYCQNGLIAVGVNRQTRSNYTNPDDQILPESFPCATCDGVERDESRDTEPTFSDTGALVAFGVNAPDCATCDGVGEVPATFATLADWARREHGATTVLGLSGPHDWGCRWNMYDYAPNDDDVDGLIFDTAAKRAETGSDTENMATYLAGELEEYNRWADGECYGFIVADVNGDIVESCGGYIGLEWCKQAADEATPRVAPRRLYSVRLAAAQWKLIREALEPVAVFADGNVVDVWRPVLAAIDVAAGGEA